MFINEVASESVVELLVKNKEGREIVLTSVVVMPLSEGEHRMILVEPFMHEGHLLVFNSVMCQASITNADDNKIYKFRLRAVAKKEHEGKIYHCLVSNEEVNEENRRTAKRFGLSAKGSIQLLGNTATMKGYVRDISATGISFLLAASSLQIGDKVSVDFVHELSGARVKVVAQIVRSVEEEKGTLFGCVVHKHDAKYTQVISYLMRQECKVRN